MRPSGCAALILVILVALATWCAGRGRRPHVAVDLPVVGETTDGVDRIDLVDYVSGTLATGDETLVLVDARDAAGTCLNDFQAPADLSFTNLRNSRSSPPCERPDEIAVLSIDDPLTIANALEGTSLWTDDPGDRVAVSMAGGLTKVPVVVWVVSTSMPGCDASAGSTDVSCDIAALPIAYNLQRTGLDIVTDVRDMTTDAAAAAAIGNSCRAGIVSTGYYVSGQLNVYYVPGLANGASGMLCRDVGLANVVYIDHTSRPQVLLGHELGHAFGLGHTLVNGNIQTYMVPPGEAFSDGNLMASWPQKEELRAGQAFRSSVSSWSWVNIADLRPGKPQRPCEALYTEELAHKVSASVDGECPRISRPW